MGVRTLKGEVGNEGGAAGYPVIIVLTVVDLSQLPQSFQTMVLILFHHGITMVF